MKKIVTTLAIVAVVSLNFGLVPPARAEIKVKHRYGLDLATVQPYNGVTLQGSFREAPASFALFGQALPAGYQGDTNSCVAWALGYSGYGILMHEQKISGAPMAPMFLYSIIVKEKNGGRDSGTSAAIALPLLRDRGITTQRDWGEGTENYQLQPTAAQLQNASRYKLSSYTNLKQYANVKAAMKDSISSGHPVAFGALLKSSFDSITAENDIYVPSGDAAGGHEMIAIGYDETYVTVQNSWGTDWGNQGFFRVSWDWFASDAVKEIHSLNGVRRDFVPRRSKAGL